MISAYNLYDVYCHGLNIQWGGGGVQCVCAHIVQCVQHWLVGWSVGWFGKDSDEAAFRMLV